MILVFDTSTHRLSIGLADDSGALLREFYAEAAPDERGIHDARLAIEAERLMQEAGVHPNQFSRIGLIIGPGSFTGLRIGLSFAKGLAFATGAAIVPLTQHEVIAADGIIDNVIVTAGYREDLFYLAEAASPSEIRLVNREELPSSFIIHHSSLSTLARLTARATETIGGEAIDSLEPLYLTEFKPGIR